MGLDKRKGILREKTIQMSVQQVGDMIVANLLLNINKCTLNDVYKS